MRGFSLLEVIVAISILTTGIAGAVALISQTISMGSLATRQLVAAHLAQEGVEVIHNIRHTNWVEEANDGVTKWFDGLSKPGCAPDPFANSSCPIYVIVNYNSSAITETLGPLEQPSWKVSFNGARYIHDLGSPVYSRHIEISYAIDNNGTAGCTNDDKPYMIVKSIVSIEGANTSPIRVEDNLYNWKDTVEGVC